MRIQMFGKTYYWSLILAVLLTELIITLAIRSCWRENRPYGWSSRIHRNPFVVTL